MSEKIKEMLAELRELEGKASKGPWFSTCDEYTDRPDEDVWTVGPKQDGENWATDSGQWGYGIFKKDADFIAAMRNALPQLLEYIEDLEFWNNSYRHFIGQHHPNIRFGRLKGITPPRR